MDSLNIPVMTSALLRSYSDAALKNSDELLVEASLLMDHGHNARAYFLSFACIEEAGKALLAFDAQSRNLSDPAVCSKLKLHMGSHSHKINYALGTWAISSSDPTESLKLALDLIFHLKRGREPSMYCDLRANPDRVQIPSEAVSTRAAIDCARLAGHTLAHAHCYVSRTVTPTKYSVDQDRLFTMKTGKFQSMLNNEDFWRYFISRMDAGERDLAVAVIGYEKDHLTTGVPFRAAE